jgi:signal transduction histidine kinase
LIVTDIADRQQSDLLTRMSHEMRTPLSAILGFAQLMQSGRPSPTDSQKKSIARILQAGWHLEKLIAMTLDLALIESGTLAVSLAAVPLAAVMGDVKAMIESQAQSHGVRVIFPEFDPLGCVWADPRRLQEALVPLLSVAIEHSAVGGSIVVDYEQYGADWMRIGIRDGGGGSTAAMDGTGMRLLLARRLIELMGGVIRAHGDDGTGKAVFVDLKRII